MIGLVVRPAWQRVALLLALALVAQSTILHWFNFRNATPSAVLVLVVWYGLAAGRNYGMAFGLVAGMLEDALSYGTGGTGGGWTISTAIAGFFAGSVRGAFFTDSLLPAAGVIIAATLLRALVYWSMMALEGYPSGLAAPHAHAALWQALENALLFVVLTFAARWFESWKGR